MGSLMCYVLREGLPFLHSGVYVEDGKNWSIMIGVNLWYFGPLDMTHVFQQEKLTFNLRGD